MTKILGGVLLSMIVCLPLLTICSDDFFIRLIGLAWGGVAWNLVIYYAGRKL